MRTAYTTYHIYREQGDSVSGWTLRQAYQDEPPPFDEKLARQLLRDGVTGDYMIVRTEPLAVMKVARWPEWQIEIQETA